MNDQEIRESFHRKKLHGAHLAQDTLVVDELGLKHGLGRADIAVINGQLIGYEIKSENDSLRRIPTQIENYSAIFDKAYVIAESPHLSGLEKLLPEWWGIVLANQGPRGGIHFKNVRVAKTNPSVDNYSVAQLLWRNEVAEELSKLGFSGKVLRQKRSILYGQLVEALDPKVLRNTVRAILRNRKNWRCHLQLSQYGD